MVQLSVDSNVIEGNLSFPEGAEGIVLFAHGATRQQVLYRIRGHILDQTELMDLYT